MGSLAFAVAGICLFIMSGLAKFLKDIVIAILFIPVLIIGFCINHLPVFLLCAAIIIPFIVIGYLIKRPNNEIK